MATVHGRLTAVLIGQYDLSAYTNSAAPSHALEPAETTTFGATAKTYIAGLRDGTMSLAGNCDFSSGASDDIIQPAIDGSQKVFTIGFGGTTLGNRAHLAILRQTQYGISAPVGDVVSWSADLQADGGIDAGVWLHALEAETGTENGTSVDNGAASTNGYAANLHVTVDDFSTLVVKVQHSTDNVSFSDLCTFASASGVTSEQKTGTGTVNRYVRYALTTLTGTSATFAVAFARR